jgi:hypothetical protein
MSTSSLDQLELQLEELEASADPHAAEQKFSAPWRRKPGSQLTRRWRGESTANSSLKLGADSGRVMDDSGIVKGCFALDFRRKLSSLPWQPAPLSDN